MKKIKKTADFLIKRLKAEGIVVQRYDSYSSNSIYLKLDFGACHTIRLSDHKGKRHLSYRYNVLTVCEEPIATKDGLGRVKYYFPIKRRQLILDKILYDRKQLIDQWGDPAYREFMSKCWRKGQSSKGFWQSARVV